MTVVLPEGNVIGMRLAELAPLHDGLPRQAQQQGFELRTRQLQRARVVAGPDELAGVELPGDQSHADA